MIYKEGNKWVVQEYNKTKHYFDKCFDAEVYEWFLKLKEGKYGVIQNNKKQER